jgi:hypothetical protein
MSALKGPYSIVETPDLPPQFHSVKETEFLPGDRIEKPLLSISSKTAIIGNFGVDEFGPSYFRVGPR